ncbi:nitronate monooxygenase [Chitinivorax sp. B]|uniref:NAD(P)H-dependent flavin oxidoreductase n=1 Tax=Chitinivorax sp. B TaxID=2502235 RepID=UPI0010F439B3|nr:nitronate monooxygenase [Chitinivorax sp. B]
MKTRLTELLGIEHPVVCPGMSWIAVPELVAAVSNAGGLGILATGPLTAVQTREAIRQIRSLTDKPFGIGCTLMMPGARENAEVALKDQVPVINFSLGKGDWIVQRAHAYGGKVIATVVTEKHAQAAERIGCDALLVTGHEAAAHGGEVTSLVLVPAIARKVKIPVIATGGFGNGAGLLAALALGADGVAMGTRFAMTRESPVHSQTKAAIAEKQVSDTLYSTRFDGIPCRVMKTPMSEYLQKKPMGLIKALFTSLTVAREMRMPIPKLLLGTVLKGPGMMLQIAYFGAATPRFKKATEQGDLDHGVQMIGQVQGLIDDVPTVAELMPRIMNEAVLAFDSLSNQCK